MALIEHTTNPDGTIQWPVGIVALGEFDGLEIEVRDGSYYFRQAAHAGDWASQAILSYCSEAFRDWVMLRARGLRFWHPVGHGIRMPLPDPENTWSWRRVAPALEAEPQPANHHVATAYELYRQRLYEHMEGQVARQPAQIEDGVSVSSWMYRPYTGQSGMVGMWSTPKPPEPGLPNPFVVLTTNAGVKLESVLHDFQYSFSVTGPDPYVVSGAAEFSGVNEVPRLGDRMEFRIYTPQHRLSGFLYVMNTALAANPMDQRSSFSCLLRSSGPIQVADCPPNCDFRHFLLEYGEIEDPEYVR